VNLNSFSIFVSIGLGKRTTILMVYHAVPLTGF
jgi:hypothetical protein